MNQEGMTRRDLLKATALTGASLLSPLEVEASQVPKDVTILHSELEAITEYGKKQIKSNNDVLLFDDYVRNGVLNPQGGRVVIQWFYVLPSNPQGILKMRIFEPGMAKIGDHSEGTSNKSRALYTDLAFKSHLFGPLDTVETVTKDKEGTEKAYWKSSVPAPNGGYYLQRLGPEGRFILGEVVYSPPSVNRKGRLDPAKFHASGYYKGTGPQRMWEQREQAILNATREYRANLRVMLDKLIGEGKLNISK